MGRNSPAKDFWALGLSASISVSELESSWGVGHRDTGPGVPPKRIPVTRASPHRAKVRASLVASVSPEALGPWIMAKAMVIIYSLRWKGVFRRNSVKRREKLSLSSADIKMDFYFLKDPPRRERISVNLIYAPQPNSRNRNKS